MKYKVFNLYYPPMAFPIRIEYAGAGYHITSLGNARQSILKDDKDREVFLELLEKGLRPLYFSFGLYSRVGLKTTIYPDFCKEVYKASLPGT